MLPHISNHLPLFLRSPRNVIALGFSIAVASGVTTYILTRRKPTAEEIERARRDQLALTGRITDGSITETQWLPIQATPPAVASPAANPASRPGSLSLSIAPTADPLPANGSDQPQVEAPDTPAILVYRYVIAGVTYECAQDVHTLADHVRHVRIDLPIQVRFDPRNPGNSIVVAESWSGLRLAPSSSDPQLQP